MRENEFLKKVIPYFNQDPTRIVIGPGDDCAVLKYKFGKYLLYAVDQLVSDVHYLFDHDNLEEIGAKLLKRNLSDIASMGGVAFSALVTASVSSSSQRLEQIYLGLSKEAKKWKVSVCGGDVSGSLHAKTETFTLSILGEVKKDHLCLRSNAKEGDLLYATGKYGNSYNSGHHFKFIPRMEEGIFLSHGFTCAMMDVSDGLLIDLQRFCEASGVSLLLNTKNIPWREGTKDLKNVLSDGEDYELIFAINPRKEKRLIRSWPFPEVALTKIGEFKARDNESTIIDTVTSKNLLEEYTGFEHTF